MEENNLPSCACFSSNPIEYLNVIIQGIRSFFLILYSDGNATKQAVRCPFFDVCTRQGGIRDDDDDHSSFLLLQFVQASSEDDHWPSKHRRYHGR